MNQNPAFIFSARRVCGQRVPSVESSRPVAPGQMGCYPHGGNSVLTLEVAA